MKNIRLLLLTVLVCCFLTGCGKNLDMSKLISSPVKEIIIHASGKEEHIRDQETIDLVAESIRKTIFKPTRASELNVPGAITIRIDVVMEQGNETITYPCFKYNSRIYDAGADSVRLFYDYIGQ